MSDIPAELVNEAPAVVEEVPARRVVELAGNQVPQDQFIKDWREGVTLASGGVGSGKTWAGARKFLAIHHYNKCNGMMVGPTWSDLARLMVAEVLSTCREWNVRAEYWPHGHGDEQFPHMRVFGHRIYLCSADAPERITGFQAGHCWGDEAARFLTSEENPTRDAPMQIGMRLRDPRAKIIHWLNTTTPEGMGTWVQRDFFDKPKGGHRYYILPTRGNKALRSGYIERQMAEIPASMQLQYLEGQAVNYAKNRAHPAFTRERNVRDIPWRSGVPVEIGCDFNVSPMCWTAGQRQPNGDLAILDELTISDNAQVDFMVHGAHARGWGEELVQGVRVPRDVVVHPDRSAKNRSTTGDPEVVVLLNSARALRWRVSGSAHGSNPPINGRINNVERALLDASGRTRLWIHPRCERLMMAMERTARLANGYDPGKDGKMGHELDGLGYMVWDCLPITSPIESRRGLNG